MSTKNPQFSAALKSGLAIIDPELDGIATPAPTPRPTPRASANAVAESADVTTAAEIASESLCIARDDRAFLDLGQEGDRGDPLSPKPSTFQLPSGNPAESWSIESNC